MGTFPPRLRASALVLLRVHRQWSGLRLAQKAGVSPNTISRYESGKIALDEERLLELAALMGYGPEAVRLAAEVVERLEGQAEAPSHPLEPGEARQRELRAQALRLTLGLEPLVHRALRQEWSAHQAEADRERARAVIARLEEVPLEERRSRFEAEADRGLWALAPELGERSERAAPSSAKEAAGWASLARLAAELAEVPESCRSGLRACALFFTANAERVGNDVRASEATFARAWSTFQKDEAQGLPLQKWQFLDLEASLRSDQGRSEEAVALLRDAIGTAPSAVVPRLQLKLSRFYLNDFGDFSQALQILEGARPAIEKGGTLHLRVTLASQLALSLLGLGRVDEAAPFASEARRWADTGGLSLDLLRCEWTLARIAQEQGRLGEARLAYREVRLGFAALQLGLDAALAGLDEAVLLLEEGTHGELRELSAELFTLLRSGELATEAVAALRIFCVAAEREAATAELARRTIETLRQARSGIAPGWESRSNDR